MAIRGGCGRLECSASTGIDEEATFGTGNLDENGFWEFPCNACRSAYKKACLEEKALEDSGLRARETGPAVVCEESVRRINWTSGVSSGPSAATGSPYRGVPPHVEIMTQDYVGGRMVIVLPKELSERQISSILSDVVSRCADFGIKV